MIEIKIENDIMIHYSDSGMKIRQIETGLVFDYGEAGDSIPCPYTYEELDSPVDMEDEEDEEIDDAEAIRIIMGVAE